jgi:hypothetical protein
MVNAKKLCMFKPPMTYWNGFTPRKKLPYDLSIVSCPVAVIAGGSDYLVQPDVVRSSVKKCVLTHIEPNYEHLDVIWADTAPSLIFPIVLNMLETYSAENS